MARRKTLNRKRSSARRSIEFGSGFLDPDTNIVDEEQTSWWNHLQENTFARHSLIHDVNETARQLSVNSRMDSSQSPPEWWRNLKVSASERAASTSPKRNLSAAIVKSNILQTSETSESEKELDLRKKKVRLKTYNRKSINNAFSNALDNTEVAKPSKLQKKQANYSDLHNDSNSRKKLQENEEDNNLSPTEKILKSKSSISRRRRHESTEDQNPFQDILTEDDVLNNSKTRKSIARSIEKESSKRSMHRNVDVSKDHNDDQRKSMRASQTIPLESIEPKSSNSLTPNVENAILESNAKEIVQSSDDSDTKIIHNKLLKLKSHFMQRARKSMGRNVFADVLAVDSSVDSNFSVSDPNEENDIRKSPLQSSINLSKTFVDRSKTNITHENSPIRRSSRSSLNVANKQSLDVPTKDNIEVNSSSSGDNEFRKKKSVFFKPKSKILENVRESVTKNLYEEILEKDDINAEKSNISTKDNHSSFERDEIVTRTSQVRKSLAIEKSSRSKRNKTSEEDSYDTSLATPPTIEKDVSSENENEQSENRDLTNVSKSISRKNVIAKAPEKEFSSNRKSAREETLKEHTRINVIGTSTNEITHEIVNDDAHDDTDIEQDLSRFKRVSSPSKEVHLTRNSLRNRSEIPTSANIGEHEVIDDSQNDNANREHDSSMSKRVSKTSPAKETRLTRNSLRNRSETPKPANRGIHEVIDNSYNEANREHDSSMSKRVSRTSPAKEIRLTRNSLRNRSETPKPANRGIHEVIDNSYNETNREHDSSMSKRVSKTSPAKETRLTRNSLRNRSETPKPASRGIHEVIDNSYNEANREHDSSMSKRVSKSSPAKETRLTRNSSRNSEPSKPASKDMPKRSTNWIADIEEDDNVNNSEINIDGVSQIISSTRISKVSVNNTGIHKSTVLSEIETVDDRDADPRMQTIHQRSSMSTKVETGNKTVNRPSVQSSTGNKEGRDTASRQKSLGKSQNYRSTPIKVSNKDISFKANKLNSSKTLKKIDDFFKVKQASTTMDKQSNERAKKTQIFDTEKMEKIKAELERIKNREMAAMKILVTDKKETVLKAKNMKPVTLKQATKKKPLANPTREVNKAFLVGGKVYRRPKLPRPKHWATDRLYKFLWNRMEPKYKLATRLKSEKFMQELAKIVSVIERRTNYKSYKPEMEILMKEMARLKIISTRNDFYHFCQDFLPYEFRVKVVPMLLPGNKMNIPYNPEKLHTPLLDITD